MISRRIRHANRGSVHPMNIPELLGEMQDAVAKHKRGELELGWRIRLWNAMNGKFGEKDAAFRRNTLARLVARYTLPVWEQGQLAEAIPSEEMGAYGEPYLSLDHSPVFHSPAQRPGV